MTADEPAANTDNSEGPERQPPDWFVYMIRTAADRLYTGITTDPDRRLREHARGVGAKFFRLDRPGNVVYLERCPDRSAASRREHDIKKLSRRAKLALAASGPAR